MSRIKKVPNHPDYPNLKNFLAGYFMPYWEELHDFDSDNPTYEDVIYLYIGQASTARLKLIIAELRKLISLKLDEAQLRNIVNRQLGSNLYVPALGLTYDKWLRHVLEIMESSQKE